KLPLVQFANPNGMADRGSDVFSETINSGNFNLKEAGQGGVGRYVAGALEQANVELSEQLTNMIIAQKGYQANTKTIKTSNELLDALNSIIV
ncbi:MAG: flagellar hook-basal body complex protein, partial [Methanobacterium sp.]